MIQVETLVRGCHSGERHDIEEMMLRAAEYIQSVVALEVKTKNIVGEASDQLAQEIQSAQITCTVSLNGFIVYVEKVNRICHKYEKQLVYLGTDNREEYVEFALELVAEILSKGSYEDGIV